MSLKLLKIKFGYVSVVEKGIRITDALFFISISTNNDCNNPQSLCLSLKHRHL